MDPRPAADSRAVLVRWMGIMDADAAGFVHGGAVMKLCEAQTRRRNRLAEREEIGRDRG